MTTRELGRTGIHVSAIGLGGSQFSGGGRSSFFPALPQSQVDAIVGTALDGGVTWFDTAGGRGAMKVALSNEETQHLADLSTTVIRRASDLLEGPRPCCRPATGRRRRPGHSVRPTPPPA